MEFVPQPGEASPQLGRRHRGGQSRGALVELREGGRRQGGRDSADDLPRLPAQPRLGQRGARAGQVVDQQAGVLERARGHTLGHGECDGELGPDRALHEVARLGGRPAAGERLRATQSSRVRLVQRLGGGEVERSRGAGEQRRAAAEGADLLESLPHPIRHTRIEPATTDTRAADAPDREDPLPEDVCGGASVENLDPATPRNTGETSVA